MPNLTEQRLSISGMSCAACVGRVESALTSTSGVDLATVSLATNEATVTFDETSVSIDDLIASIETAGYSASVDGDDTADPDDGLRARLLVGVALSTVLMAVGMGPLRSFVPPDLLNPLLLILTTPVQFWCGWPFLSGFLSALQHRTTNMNSLIAVGTLAAFCYSLYVTVDGLISDAPIARHVFFETSAMIITFVLVGRVLEHRARNRTSDAIRKLMDLQPDTARVEREGSIVEIPVGEVVIDDRVHIRPGDRVPVDGRIVDGASALDESLITGESMPVERQQGDTVVAGSINKTGSFYLIATGVGSDTAVARIVDLVKQAQASRPPIQRLADLIASRFVPIIFGIALVTFFAWWLSGSSAVDAMINAIAVLIISCPCALGLATPTAILVGTGKGAESGLLIRSGEVVETAHSLRTIVFDKTGTLTEGRPVVTDIHTNPAYTEEEILRLAGSLERNSEHPIGRAIVDEASSRGIALSDPVDFDASAGGGVTGEVDDRRVCLGNRRFVRRQGHVVDIGEAERLEADGKTTVHVLVDGQDAGVIAVSDRIKDSATETIGQLKDLDLEIALLTGDNLRTAEAVGRELGIDLVVAEVLPEDKANRITALQQAGGTVGMVGDGINDAPALARADVGIAVGTGTDVAIESADVALMSDNLLGVPAILRLSRRTMRTIRQNLFWAFAYNVVLIPVAAIGLLNPWGGPMLASGAMAFSSVSVVLNALRLKRFDPLHT